MNHLVIVTGTAGAGKSTALRALEDLGYFCIDNLPVLLLRPLAETARPYLDRVAVVMDLRDPDFLRLGREKSAWLREHGVEVFSIFLHARQDVLLCRFSQLRRPHPLFTDMPLPAAIEKEQGELQQLRVGSDAVIDTTNLSPHQLKAQLRALFEGRQGDCPALRLAFYSFGYKHGMPPEADMVLDARFLPNPYFVAALKEKTGRQRQVADYVLESDAAKKFLTHLLALLHDLIPRYEDEGKAVFTVAIGCTGGRHRSVAVVEWLQKQLAAAGYQGRVWHRELPE